MQRRRALPGTKIDALCTPKSQTLWVYSRIFSAPLVLERGIFFWTSPRMTTLIPEKTLRGTENAALNASERENLGNDRHF
ncbi:MAG: hypothetical protein P8Y45_11385 [Exilibacterium sp.]